MSYEVTLNALSKSYTIPSAGETNYVNDLSLYLRDLATAVNDAGGGSVVSPYFNVKTYGATGNGVTDDTAAINLAIAAQRSAGVTAGALYFPSGTYVISSSLTFGVLASQTNVKVFGDGPNQSIIKPTGAFGANAVLRFESVNYWSISNLRVDGSSRTGTGDLVLINNSSFGLMSQTSLINSTRYGISITGTSTYNTVDWNYFSGNASGNTSVVVATTALGNVANSLTGAFPAPFVVDVKTQFGVAADDSTDDTVALQAALDYGFYVVDTLHQPCALQLPPGTCKVTSTLIWKGNSATAPALLGALPNGSAFNFAGTTLKWYGADNGKLFFAQSANKGVLQDIMFDGNSKAGILCHLSASTFADPAILAATSGIRVLRCGFKNVKLATAGNGCVALGTDPAFTGGATFQQSEVIFRDCRFNGEDPGASGFNIATMQAYGIKTLAGGNCKNFAAEDCGFNFCYYAIDWTNASGNFNVWNFDSGAARRGFASGGGELVVVGGNIECTYVDDYRLLYGTGGGGEALASITGLNAVVFMSGAVGTLIDWQGSLTLTNNYFANFNNSVGGGSTLNPYKIIVPNCVDNFTSAGSIDSSGNYYVCCPPPYAPFFDSSGNSLAPVTGTYGGETAQRVRSFGDKYSATFGATAQTLDSFDSTKKTVFSQRMNGRLALSYVATASPAAPYVVNKTITGLDATGGAKVWVAPTLTSNDAGNITVVFKTDASVNTVTANGQVLANQNEAVLILWDGTTFRNLTLVP